MLSAENLSKTFRGSAAVQGLTLHVGASDIYCLLGANGAGKTTTLNLFLGFLKPDSGQISVEGVNPAVDPDKARARLATFRNR